MKKVFSIMVCFVCMLAFAQRVPQNRMQQIYEEVRTPYKYGLVVAPTTNKYKIDCPSVFKQGNSWYMTYVIYNGKEAKDGRGYETWLAQSPDLLHWKTLGRVLAYPQSGWDMNQRGGFPALQNMTWGGNYQLGKYKGRHWMTYIGGPGTGYEAVSAPLSIGVASTKSDITVPHQWDTYSKPILSWNDPDVQWWEQLTQYKSTVYKDDHKTLGYPFVMFYNAGGKDATHPKGERIGIALSKDMMHWTRYAGNPVFAHDADGTITGDAQIQRIGDAYVMFYFSAFNPTRKYKAFNTFAASYDLVHWTDWTGSDLIIPSKPYDELFAHKSCVIKQNGVIYHFYCAVNNDGQRGIAVATSNQMGKSEISFPLPDAKGHRLALLLNNDWSVSLEGATPYKIDVPNNLDDYYGVRQMEHGNLHGTAMYTKHFMAPNETNKEYFLKFEGVGTYATITLNGRNLGRYGVGRTTLSLDVTKAIHSGEDNLLEVKVEHPSMITDMPWVCGGCSSEWGFSEGSQPFGIYRNVTLEATDKVRVEPFGVHIWNNAKADSLFVETEVHNYESAPATFSLTNKLSDADGRQTCRLTEEVTLNANETKIIKQVSALSNPHLWSITEPYLYSLSTIIKRDGKATDDVLTSYGVRTISWPASRHDGDGRFYLNGSPTFINGVCEYEHRFGQSHAFADEQVDARVKEVIGAGFNAFRDAHQPHNLRYQQAWDKSGILWWPQFSAHIWYDTPQFRESFKAHLIQWVKERRNSPSVVLWGLQNESVLPRDFAQECADIIRRMDPTCGSMRLITTCNGGEGTDWNVIQNWSGTYGGKVEDYAKELKHADQLLNGEYGAWRTIGYHNENALKTAKDSGYSEEKMCDILEKKIKLAESAKDSVCGHFLWVLNSHDNPGRRQPDEALRKIDKVGPYNYKGLFTPWEQPTDAYYMYKSNYVSADKEPMVYIVSHTWADRFVSGSHRTDISVYSNCDSVCLYNSVNDEARMGLKKNNGRGTHFLWEHRNVQYNVLRAVAYHKGKAVASDLIVLENLPKAPGFDELYAGDTNLIKGAEGYKYVYRVNCGGDAYTDSFGQTWMQDTKQWSTSWASKFKGMNPYQTSQCTAYADPVQGTKDWLLFQTLRFGRESLSYHFPVSKGDYRVELYFMEPWYGVGHSETTDCEGLRLFDVAVNDSVAIHNLDLWAEAGHCKAVKRVIDVHSDGGELKISFPHVRAGQAVVCAVAIASKNGVATAEPQKPDFSWKDFDKDIMVKTPDSLLPPRVNTNSVTVEAKDAKVKGHFTLKEYKKEPAVCFGKGNNNSIEWQVSVGIAKVYTLRFNYMNLAGGLKKLHMKWIDSKGVILKDDILTFGNTPEKWRTINTTTGSFINAGQYKIVLTADDMDGMALGKITVE